MKSIVWGAFSRKLEWARWAQLNCSALACEVVKQVVSSWHCGSWERGDYIFLALLDGGVAVRVRDLAGFAQGGGDETVDKAQDGDGAEGDGDDVAVHIALVWE